jgi:hypothetical protein
MFDIFNFFLKSLKFYIQNCLQSPHSSAGGFKQYIASFLPIRWHTLFDEKIRLSTAQPVFLTPLRVTEPALQT